MQLATRISSVIALGLAVAPIVSAQINLGGLDNSRCRALSAGGTTGYDLFRSALTAPSYAAATGTSITLLPQVAVLDAAYLSSVDVLFVGDGSGTLAVSEMAALAAWHAAGGGLFLVADSSTEDLAVSVLAAIGSPYVYGGSVCGTSTVGNPIASFDDPLTNGPFGDIRGMDLSLTPARDILGVPAPDLIAMCQSGMTVFARHSGGAVNGPSSGPVVLSGDASFIDLFVDPASGFYSHSNLVLGLNAMSYVADGGSGGIGISFCQANANSSGSAAAITAAGSRVAMVNDVTLTTRAMPVHSFAFYLVSRTRGFVPNPGGSAGNLCLGGAIGRYVGAGQIQNSGSAGEVSLMLNLPQTPTPMGIVPIGPGDTFHWTTWFRDLASGGGVTSNFSDGTTITFI